MLLQAKSALEMTGSAVERLSALMEKLKALRSEFHWVGIYFLEGTTLYVGPYAGPRTDHVRIPVGQGVCGTAVAEDDNQIVDDVSARSNYLACNLETKSEIVVLIRDEQGKVIAQFDIDATEKAAFSKKDEQDLVALGQEILPLLLEAKAEFVKP